MDEYIIDDCVYSNVCRDAVLTLYWLTIIKSAIFLVQ